MYVRTLLVILLLILTSGAKAQQQAAASMSCTVKKVQVERLPDLNMQRSGHITLMLNGIPYVFGGHTAGFVPTPTAEYYEDGEWHVLEMIYPHDHALCMPLKSGKVLICGGHDEPLGIGQTFTLELFDPETRTFMGYGCMDKKRILHSGVQLSDGRVIISGNSFHHDGIECFDGTRQNKFVKNVNQERCRPLILPIANDNALIFGGITDSITVRNDSVIVEQLKGPTLHFPLFDEWLPYPQNFFQDPANCKISNEQEGQYVYLITVTHRESGQVAFARVDGASISLVETDATIPMEWEECKISWFSSVIVDHRVKRAYVVGRNEKYHMCIIALDYEQQPAHLTFFYTDLNEKMPFQEPVLLPDGDLLIAGGSIDNYFASATEVMRYRVSTNNESEAQSNVKWIYVLLFTIVMIGVGVVLWFLFFRKKKKQTNSDVYAELNVEIEEDTSMNGHTDQLMATIIQLMEEQQLYLNSELKVADMAELVGTSSRNVSDCIKAARDCSFSQFVNAYRIDYAKQLLISEPDIKVAAVALQSGFANEMSFFRTFKAHIGMTPKEWKDSQPS